MFPGGFRVYKVGTLARNRLLRYICFEISQVPTELAKQVSFTAQKNEFSITSFMKEVPIIKKPVH